ncbi:hypothetical protein JHD46_05405 [Sulfurimonas sp. SAG-AH-194-C20]|nr:hypothetical protein [Sulfurimonas sp. SAG-AH-194-C20]MDF1879076.1 hypothetical protein [Sulfurimonas sp. SAG-AH-194-C20]
MAKRKHSNEITRWATASEEVRVWTSSHKGEWVLLAEGVVPPWNEDTNFVVDGANHELFMLLHDGAVIEVKVVESDKWEVVDIDNLFDIFVNVYAYRILSSPIVGSYFRFNNIDEWYEITGVTNNHIHYESNIGGTNIMTVSTYINSTKPWTPEKGELVFFYEMLEEWESDPMPVLGIFDKMESENGYFQSEGGEEFPCCRPYQGTCFWDKKKYQ